MSDNPKLNFQKDGYQRYRTVINGRSVLIEKSSNPNVYPSRRWSAMDNHGLVIWDFTLAGIRKQLQRLDAMKSQPNPAKLPVGKMIRVKPGEVVTGYQLNRNGTTSLLIEKNPSVRKNNPSTQYWLYKHGRNELISLGISAKTLGEARRLAKIEANDRKEAIVIAKETSRGEKNVARVSPNPSVRKSKKYFRKYAKRLGVKLPKRLPRSTTHSKGNPAKTYTHKYAWGKLKISADFSQSSSPIRYGTGGDAPTDSTPFQVSDAQHSPQKALALVNRWLRGQG